MGRKRETERFTTLDDETSKTTSKNSYLLDSSRVSLAFRYIEANLWLVSNLALSVGQKTTDKNPKTPQTAIHCVAAKEKENTLSDLINHSFTAVPHSTGQLLLMAARDLDGRAFT